MGGAAQGKSQPIQRQSALPNDSPRVPVAVRPGSVLQRSASKLRLVAINERLIGPLAAGIDCVSCRVGLAEIGREGADVYRH
jgi:hypothetical protein